MALIEAELTRCDICDAPYRKPLAPDWTKTIYKVGRRWFVQIHRPDCPAGWKPKDEEEQP